MNIMQQMSAQEMMPDAVQLARIQPSSLVCRQHVVPFFARMMVKFIACYFIYLQSIMKVKST